MEKQVNLLYCGDENIEKGLIISIISIVKHYKGKLNIIVLTASLETVHRRYNTVNADTIKVLDFYVKQVNPESSVKLIDVSKNFDKFIPKSNLDTRFTPMCMLRLFADQIEDMPDKILYLDNDTIADGDISELFGEDVEDYEFAGVLDHYGSWFFRDKVTKRDYLNSGVLLFNMKKVKETGLFEQCREKCRNQRMFMPDQTALNKLAVAKKSLPRKFNEQKKNKKDTVIRHFTTGFRFFPWVRTITVKPWDIKRMHKVLKLYKYDGILKEYRAMYKSIKKI